MVLGEEYRWNVPVLTYAFDQSFLDYFGSNGVAAVEKAFQIPMDDFGNRRRFWFGVGVLASPDRCATSEKLLDGMFAVARLEGAKGRAAPNRRALVVNATPGVLPETGLNPLPELSFFLGG